MTKISIKEKLLLVIFGIFLSLIILEIGLRIAGGIVFYLQQRHNHISFSQNECRILCLGESTTALGGTDSYPSQLEEMLNVQGPKIRFTVINQGIIGTTTDYILAHLEENLDKYKPQMVIVMMGINDRFSLRDREKISWHEIIGMHLKEFRVYKLAYLLYEHITHRIKEINAPASKAELAPADERQQERLEDFLKAMIAHGIKRFYTHLAILKQYQQNGQLSEAHLEYQFVRQAAIESSSACVELARRYRLEGLYAQAQNVLNNAAIFNINSQYVFQEQGEIDLAVGRAEQAIKAFRSSLALDPKNSESLLGLARALYQAKSSEAFYIYAGYLQIEPQDYWGYIELAQWLRQGKRYDLAQKYLGMAIGVAPYIDQAYVDMGQVLDDQGELQKEEVFYLSGIKLHPKIPRLYQMLGLLYQRQGRQKMAQVYFQKSVLPEVSEYYPMTLNNYGLLLDKILSRHIKAVVMQYPLRDISFLRNYLGQRHGVVFVENRLNFRNALSRNGYKYYFKDNFGNDFGHCTRAGDELIARNLTGVILDNELNQVQ